MKMPGTNSIACILTLKMGWNRYSYIATGKHILNVCSHIRIKMELAGVKGVVVESLKDAI